MSSTISKASCSSIRRLRSNAARTSSKNKMPFKLIFFGTSEFAVPSLRALMDDGRFEIVGIVTQPDRPVGRHAVMTAPPVKKSFSVIPAEAGTQPRLFQPEKLKDESFRSWIADHGSSCDAFVIVSYGKILPQWLLDLPKKGVVNVHGSLLPRWRGASPIQAAIASGDEMSGVTVMQIDAEMDHGPILALAEEPIHPEDSGSSLHDRLADLGAALLPTTLAGYLEGTIQPTEQDHSLATYCKILSREDGHLDPSTKTAEYLERLVRAYTPWPGTFIQFDGRRITVLEVNVETEKYKEGFFVPCANGTTLKLVMVQPEGKKKMPG